MSDIKLYRLLKGKAVELQGDASDLEKPLQTLIEKNLEPLLSIRLIASEYSTGKTHAGRIDSLGLDENNCPVILEYKRSMGESIINQGLFYLNWLMDHQAEFKLLVMEKLGKPAADKIDWSAPRLVCIAADFTRYDAHAVQQMNRNIELIRYRRFGDDLLLLELVNAINEAEAKKKSKARTSKVTGKTASGDKTLAEWMAIMPDEQRELLTSLEDYILSLGDDVQRKELKLYLAFRRLKNFATVVIQKNKLMLCVHVNPLHVKPLPANARDVRKIGHWGTGDLELPISNSTDLDIAKAFILKAYEGK